MNHGDTLERLERNPLTGLGDDAPNDGDFVCAWIDGIFEGYWLDPGRTAVAGRNPALGAEGDCRSDGVYL